MGLFCTDGGCGCCNGSVELNPGGAPRRTLHTFTQHTLSRYIIGMTNQIAIGLAVFILGFLALDYFVLHLDALTFILRKLIELIRFIAFWR